MTLSGQLVAPVPSPPAAPAAGPLTRTRLRRSAAVYAACVVLGAALLLLADSPALQAFGVGLWFPGAGFLAAGGWVALLTPVAVVLFLATLVAWFGAGATTFPPALWLLAAGGAAALAGRDVSRTGAWVAAAVVALLVVGSRVLIRVTARSTEERRARRQAYLPRVLVETRDRAVPAPPSAELELSQRDLEHLRYTFDRALQPVGQFAGYDKIDQFQTAALRYQINQFGYGLSVMQKHYTPAFDGYSGQAQRNLIETYLDRQVWGYWRLENAWGKLKYQDDPVGVDNIMLTGFFGLQVALYTGLSGDQRYAEQGGLSFGPHRHDLHSVIGSLVDNYRRSAFCLFPCEPNWIYTACNFRGLAALQAYDRAYGTEHTNELKDVFRAKLDAEFTAPDFAMVALRSQITGLQVPFPLPDAVLPLFLSSLYPDLAERYWAITREEAFEERDGLLEAIVPKTAIDVPAYRKGYGMHMETLLGAARERGDADAAEAALRALDRLCSPVVTDGVGGYAGASNAINACVTLDRMLHQGFWRDTVLDPVPDAVLTGPRLATATYPDVLVARAHTDGRSLDLVLQPGRAGGVGTQQLGLDRLLPGSGYTAEVDGRPGERLVADARGALLLDVPVAARTTVRLTPAR
ncbi:MAG: hypothetical protein JWM64_1254 [Frankiales bacterium]|nr:hypothetical protein [Frankiales bacterium]